MALIRCKMCGGQLNIEPDSSVCECEYCGSKQTIPNTDDEKRLKLYERANRLRFDCEFDKASGVYESIVSEYQEEAEAYWGLVLCKYGIEYVDDPASGKKIPTCHRSSFDSVMDDQDFEMVMENADVVARSVYREEAKRIEEIRKGILEVSSTEEPYDIFICYKETADNGDRTIDSVIAQDVYKELTAEGYRVFFSRITLEDKLGQEYEPYIFAALNSAKVMLAFGTSYDYYNAVWVKNEWSRFLKLIAEGQKKTLIPCYKDIDAYDMPKEFKHLQAQDMGKVGAVQDLIRGIEKLIGKKNANPTQSISGGEVYTSNVLDAKNAAQLKRGFIALEDGEWENANTFFEEVLNYNAECAEAYLGKFLAREKAASLQAYKDTWTDKINNTVNRLKQNEKSAEKFVACETDGDRVDRIVKDYSIDGVQGLTEKEIRKELVFDRSYLSGLSAIVAYRDRFLKGIEDDRYLLRTKQYGDDNLVAEIASISNDFTQLFDRLVTDEENNLVIQKNTIIEKYQEHLQSVEDSIRKRNAEWNESQKHKYEELKTETEALLEDRKTFGRSEALRIINDLNGLNGYGDSEELIRLLNRECKYKDAIAYFAIGNEDSIKTALSTFESIADYKESPEYISKCKNTLNDIEEERERQRLEEQKKREEEEKKEREIKARKRKKRRRIIITVSIVIILATAGALSAIFYFIPEYKYKEAIKKLENDDFSGAIELFEELGDYKDSEEKIEEAHELEEKEQEYQYAVSLVAGKGYSYAYAVQHLEKIDTYKDSSELIKLYNYEFGKYLLENEYYTEAINVFEDLGDYEDSKDCIEVANNAIDNKKKYQEAVTLVSGKYYDKEKYNKAKAIFEELGDYKESKDYLEIINNVHVCTLENINEAVVGDYVELGQYGDGLITWIVAKNYGGKLLLVSTSVVSEEVFSNPVETEDANLITWLEWFKDNCFSEQEKELNIEMALLSKVEAEQYLKPKDMLEITDENEHTLSWWLKGDYVVIGGGKIMWLSSAQQETYTCYIRPVMWVSVTD